MATAYTDNIYITSKRLADGWIEAYVSSETDTTATIYWAVGCRQKSAALYGQEAYGYVDGTSRGHCEGYLTSSSSDWKSVCSTSGYATISKGGSGRNVACSVSTRVVPVDGYGSVTTGWYSASVNVWVDAITYYAPNAPSGCSVSRNSDNKNTVSWTAPSTTATKPVSAVLVERQTDGGSWSQIASVGGSTTSYADTGTSADHSYRYRVRAKNSAGTSGYSTSGTVYNTPAAPRKVTASRLAETTVKVAVENAARTATSLELQRSSDGSAWTTVATVSGSPVTETTDAPGGGTFYYRARNKRGSLASAWSAASEAVVTICPPAAPTLLSPASGVVVSKSDESVLFSWTHNPVDGSAQTAAQLRYSTDGGSAWTTEQIDGAAASREVGNAFAVNSEVTWSVRTKGADADYGPWSGNRVFRVYQAPTLAFTAPASDFTVENTPIAVELQYDDPSGSLASLKLTALDADGNAAYSLDMGTSTTASITSSDWVPDDGGAYVLRAEARSSSSLTATAEREISVDFVLPKPAGIYVEGDPETGYASLVVYVEEAEGLEAPASVSVWRESEDGRVLLGEGLQAGAGVVDRYAPLNVGYRYVATSFADSGAANSTAFDAELETPWAFLYFAGGGIARGKWNPEDSWRLEQEVDYVKYIGREFPVAYMRDAMEETHDVTVTLMDRDEAREFRRMMAAHEPIVAKLWDGLVFHAVPQVQGKPRSTVRSYWGEVAVSLTRIDGEAL